MRYLILGKNIRAGAPGNDSGSLNEYFELGWESIGSRFDLIALYNQGKINEDEVTLVTLEDRMFFYTKFYKNVISYEQFRDMNIRQEDIYGDWPLNYNQLRFLNGNEFSDPETKEYVRKQQDGDLIFNGFDLEGSIEPNKTFITMCIRHRNWCSNRNSNTSFYQELVNLIKDKFAIYVVGKGNEEFCKDNNINYVASLKDYVSLIKNKNCKCLITQSTGTAVLALTCAETDIHFIDDAAASQLNGINAVLGGKPIHFYSKKLLPYYDTSLQSLNLITKQILED